MSPALKLAEFDTDVPGPGRRNIRGNLNGRILDAILRHRHYLLWVENGLAKDIVAVLTDAKRTIEGDLRRIVGKANASDNLERLARSRLRQVEDRLREAMLIAEANAGRRLTNGLRNVAIRELEIEGRLLRRQIPAGIDISFITPDPDRIRRMVEQPLGGKLYGERMRQNYGASIVQMRQSLGTSVALGESVDQAARRLRGNVDKIAMQRSVLIARSEIQRIANDAAQATYRANSDVLKGVQVVETLDDRTCLVCAAIDGTVFDVHGSIDGPPYHAGCRGFLSPVTKSFEELGLDAGEFGPSTRASMDGQVAGSLNYADWFAQQPQTFQRRVLGPTRFEAYDSGSLTIDRMVRNQRILTLDQLPDLTLDL